MAGTSIQVEGLREVNRAFAKVSREVKTEMRGELATVAEPVRSAAEQNAEANIRNIGGAWSRMRIGITTGYVYVAPKARRHGGSPRPNLAGLLLKRAMLPAAAEKQEMVRVGLEAWLDKVDASAGFL